MAGAMWHPTAKTILLGSLLIGAVILLAAYPVGRLTEGNTDEVRRWVAARLGLTRDAEARRGA
jgi:hypothetical protein